MKRINWSKYWKNIRRGVVGDLPELVAVMHSNVHSKIAKVNSFQFKITCCVEILWWHLCGAVIKITWNINSVFIIKHWE